LRNTGTIGTLTTNSFAPRIDIATGAGACRVAVGDLNGDGRPDLAVVNNNAGTASVLQNLISSPGSITTGSFAPKLDLAIQSGAVCVNIVDIDGDGKPDLTVTAYLPQIFSVIQNLNNGGNLTSNSFAPRIDYPMNGRGHTIAVGDINGDGKPDLIVDTELNSLINIFQNVSTPGTLTSGSLAGQVELATGWNAWGVSVGDLDGDGRPDIIFGNSYDNNIQIYQNQMPFGTPVIPPSCTPPAAGIVGWWAGENNVVDNIGGDNGTLLNGAGFGAGEVGTGFSFTTTNGGVKIPASPGLDVGAGNGMTVEGWINPADLSRREEFVEWDNGDTNPAVIPWGVHLQILSPGELGLGAGNLFSDVHGADGAVHWIMAPGGTITANVFQHIAMTYDKTSGVATLYCNGVIVAQSNLGSFTPLTSYDFYIGRRPAGDSVHSFLGSIDEVSVYNRALSTNEIAAIYLAGSAGKCSSILAPIIITQPTNLTVTAHGTAAFNVTAQGTGPLAYQWNFNGTNISGATNFTLTLNDVSLAQAGYYSVLVSNLAGFVTSSNVLLTVNVPAVPPSIVAQTPSQVVLLGSPATFTVTATGSDPLGYFWKRNNVVIPGATNSSYTLLSAQLSDSGSKFSCLVSNAYGFAASTNSTLKVIDTVSNDLCSGAVVITSFNYTNVQSTVKASSYGDPVPDCIDGFGNGVWYQFTSPVNGLLNVDTLGSDFDTGLAIYTGSCGSFTEVACNDDYDGVTSALSIPTTAGTTYYFLIGGYSAHVGNLMFHLNYFTPPAFDVQPTNLAVVVSSNAVFSTSISGTQPVSYQWYFNNGPLTDDGRISGSTNTSLTIANVNTNDGGNYYLIASNFVGVTTSSVAILTPIILPPVIITPPVDVLAFAGTNVGFLVVADGTKPFGYQWYHAGVPLVDGGNISGSGTASLSISNISSADGGAYSVTVANPSGSVSAGATLYVLVPPSFTVQPLGRSVPPGLPTTFNATATGNPAPTYQWQLNGSNILGATGSSYTIPAVGITNLGFYHVVCSNAAGVTVSADAQLTYGPVAAWGRNLNNESLPPPGLTNVVNVAATYEAGFAILSDGSIARWGATTATNIPAAATNVVAMTFAGTAGYALRSDGQVVGWNGPAVPSTLSNVVQVAAGNSFGIALRAEGTLVGWGVPPNSTIPAGLNNVQSIACGNQHTVALKNDGTVVSWGFGPGTNVPAGLSGVTA
ncbi:MAG: immunoglobulin domain-containing protein, partial [Verrucomicrobia bacterium]|nr:immunoglobulin domain-containing protein [Verrucomicrobiota bacterium]